MLRAWLVACAIVAAVPACGGCDDGPEGADTEWISDGSGDPNTAPLMPLRAGVRGAGFDQLLADSVIESDGQRLLRVQILVRQLNSSNATYGGLLVGRGAEGVEYHGTEYERLAAPVLWVPDTVRVGMRWRARVPGRPTTELEVTERREEPTLLGPGIVWSITEFETGAGTAIGRLDFLEGVGLYSTGYASFAPTAVPLEGSLDDAPVAPQLPLTPLTPFNIGAADYGENLHLMHVGLVIPAGASRGTLIVKGWRACSADAGSCLEQACFDVDSSGGAEATPPPRVQTYHLGGGCVQHDIDGTLEITNDATGALVLPSGVHWVPRNKDGTFTGQNTHPIAAYADQATQEFRLLAYSGDGRNAQKRATWTNYVPGGTSFLELAEPLAGQWFSPMHTNVGVTGPDGDYAPYWSSTLSAPGEPVELAVLGGPRVLFHSQLEGETLSSLDIVSALGGIPSVTATETGHRLLVGTPGGYIDRIVRDPDGSLAREAIARVELPDGERLAAALDLGGISPDRILVVTWRPAIVDSANPQRNYGRIAYYTTTKQEPVRWPWSAAAGVIATQRNQDVVVCWPQTTLPLDPSGWLLGGTPARQAIETVPGRCALIVRDVDADPVLGGMSLAGVETSAAQALYGRLRYDVEGPVPGVGRMRVGTSSNASPAQTTPTGFSGVFAPLAAGGYASFYRLFGEGALPHAVPQYMVPSPSHSGVADQQGAGVWLAEGMAVRLIAPTSREIALSTAVNISNARFADPNGGLVLQVGSDWNHYAADGTVTALPANGAPWRLRRRTGELCASDIDLFCVDANGVETARVTPTGNSDLAALLEDDSILISVTEPDGVTQTLQRWVPGSAPVTWRTAQLFSARQALDGTVWCVLTDAITSYQAGKCTPGGFVPVDLKTEVNKRSWMAANFFIDIYSVVQGKHELWVETFGCLNGCFPRWTRLPWP